MALSTERASESLPLVELVPQWTYDVFLSFRGVDTRKGFISHLYHELHHCQDITTFFDDRDLEGGKSISLELPTAIKESHIAIVVLSPNYASSKWCLDELTNILQCMEGRNTILPVFYEVDPSDLGIQMGCFAEAFAKHEEFISTEDVKKVIQWKADLKKVSKLSGWHLKNFKCERDLIEAIINRVWDIVLPTLALSNSSQQLVGIDFELKQLGLLLARDANDVRFIGITGMGGIGKTTLAKLLFDRISRHFEVHCFLPNVREVSERDCTLVGLQKKLLYPILKEKIAEVWDEQCGSIFTKKCFRNRKVLLVLDDVDQLNQLEILAGKKDWFGMGSRIILTTRNAALLVQHGIALSYKVEGLDHGEALKLFSLNAFRKDQPEKDFLELSGRFLNYAKGLPLVLKVLGSFLYMRSRDAWNSVLDNLQKIPNPIIFDSLKISYDGLEEMEKRIFLDVVCYHKGKCKKQVIEILDRSFGISSHIMIDILIEKFLLICTKNFLQNNIEIHDSIQEMAWRIVRRDSEEPGLHSRLWLHDDIFHVFMTNTGTRAIEAIVLHLLELEEVQWSCEAFSNMHGLRFIEFDNLVISSDPKFLPYTLRIINWSWYPSKFLPPSFEPRFLTELKMHRSKLVRLWDGTKNFPNLKYMDLTFSDKLTSTPDFTGVRNLEKLNLKGCKNLVEIHPSIAVLKRLKFLNFHGCESIKSLPSEVAMDSLEYFSLDGCSKLKKIPEFVEQMKNLSELLLAGTAIEKIPSSIRHLVGLTVLVLSDCNTLLGTILNEICNLKSLQKLHISRYSKVDKLPGEMDSIRAPLDGTVAKSIGKKKTDPWRLVLSSLNSLRSLKLLHLCYCDLWEGAIPDDIGCLASLQELHLRGNNFISLPESIKWLSNLESLDLSECQRLQELLYLPSNSILHINVNNCTSLKRLLDPSKFKSRFATLYDFTFSSVNCIRLVEDEGWIVRIFSMIVRWATWIRKCNEGFYEDSWEGRRIVCPGSEIPEWFSNQCEGPSLTVETPPHSCTNWLGIAFCVVLGAPEDNLGNPAALLGYDYLSMQCIPALLSWSFLDTVHLLTEHLWVFYLPREQCSKQFSFEMRNRSGTSLNNVKKCGARLVYKEDLEELTRILCVCKNFELVNHNFSLFNPYNLGRSKKL